MSLKISLFDFLSYTISGWLYLFEIFFFLNVCFPGKVDFSLLLNSVTIVHVLLLIPVSFVLGHILDEFSKALFKSYNKIYLQWLRIIKKDKYRNCRNMESIVEKDIKEEFNKDYEINLEVKQWSSYYAYLQPNNSENISEIQWMKVTHVLLRNLGLVAFSFSLFSFLLFFIMGLNTTYMILSILSLVLLFPIMKRCWKFLWNGYYMICTAMIATQITPNKLITKKE